MESRISEYNDEKILMFVRENNEEAKDFLYEKYSPLIHKEINRVKKKCLALGIEMADVSQEAMLGFSNAIGNYDGEEDTKFITFATICIRRRLGNYIASFETAKNKTMHDSIAFDATIDDTQVALIDRFQDMKNNDPLKKMINSESLKEVTKIIEEKLSDNERLALKYDLDGKSVEEIAEAMHMNNKQIYNLIHRARQKIKA